MKRKISGVLDGDTIKTKVQIQGTNYVRLRGIDTPEKGERGFDLARKRLRKELGRKPVNITPVARDKFGRIVAEVRNGRRSVNNAMKKYRY